MKLLILIIFVSIFSCSLSLNPTIDITQTNSIGIIGSNLTIIGTNFADDYQIQSFCDWQEYGSYLAYYVNSNEVICQVPSYAIEGMTIIRIANFHQFDYNYTLYSNEATVELKKPSNNLLISEISPYQPISGNKVYIELSFGSFVNANVSENLCKFGNVTTFAYRENRTSAFCYAPYTSDYSGTVSVTSNGGLTWSNEYSFTYHKILIASLYPTTGTTNTNIELTGVFSADSRYKMKCMFVNYLNANDNKTTYATQNSVNTTSCLVPKLNSSTYYQVYLSEDLGYHWTPYVYHYFYYSSSSPQSNIPVINQNVYLDLSKYNSIVYGNYFTSSIQCRLVKDYDFSPYYNATYLFLNYVSNQEITINSNIYNLTSFDSYYLVCSNDGIKFSAKRSVYFVPSVSSVSPYSLTPYDHAYVYGNGFSSANGQTTYCKLTYSTYSTIVRLIISSSTTGKFTVPYITNFSGQVYVTCSNDNIRYSTNPGYFSYYNGSYHRSTFNFGLWMPLISLVVFLIVLFFSIIIRRSINKRHERKNQSLVSPLETHQIELDSIDNDPVNQQNQQQQEIPQYYYPVQQINQMPMFGYPTPIQYFPNPNMLQNQMMIPNIQYPQNYVLPQAPLSQNFQQFDNQNNNNNNQN